MKRRLPACNSIMFIPIDYEQWDRKEIYDAFHGYLYCMTVELDITEFLKKIHENHWKFYPSMCYCIAKTVNGHQDYRYAKINGQVGYFDQVNPHYTLLRTNSNHLFTQSEDPISGLIIARILLPSINNFWKIKSLGKPAKLCTIQRKTT